MTVRMTTNYHPTTGTTNTVVADKGDVQSFSVNDDRLRVVFKGGVAQVTLQGYVPTSTLDDKSKYWKTSELLKQLRDWLTHIENTRDAYKRGLESAHNLKMALDYQIQASLLRDIISDLEAGGDIWPED